MTRHFFADPSPDVRSCAAVLHHGDVSSDASPLEPAGTTSVSTNPVDSQPVNSQESNANDGSCGCPSAVRPRFVCPGVAFEHGPQWYRSGASRPAPISKDSTTIYTSILRSYAFNRRSTVEPRRAAPIDGEL